MEFKGINEFNESQIKELYENIIEDFDNTIGTNYVQCGCYCDNGRYTCTGFSYYPGENPSSPGDYVYMYGGCNNSGYGNNCCRGSRAYITYCRRL